LASVRCDGIQIEQVLMNLILNGTEAMVDTPPDDRRICVRSECVGRSAVRLSVSDCGPGLTPAEADRVFDAFYTTKADGLGLGLTISRTIVESHGGSLQVVPNVDGGLTVSFTLPISPTQLLA
jgi:signal transduction histidine kinase